MANHYGPHHLNMCFTHGFWAGSQGNETQIFDISSESSPLTTLTFTLGSQANTSGSGITLSSSHTKGLSVYADDGGANIAESVRAIQARTLLTIDQSAGTIRSLQGQLKLADGIDVTTGIYTANQGYLELMATHSAKTGSTLSCFDASLEIGTALTVDSGGEVFGVHVETTGAGTITNSGTCAAIGITTATSAAEWPMGLYIGKDTALVLAQFGTLGQNADGSGISIKDATRYAGELNPASLIKIFADTDSAAITGDNATFWVRNLIGTTQTVSATWSGIRSHLYLPTGVNLSAGFWNCVRGYIECAGATTLSDATICLSGLEGYFGLSGTITIGAAAVLAGVKSIIANEAAGAFAGTGKAVAFYIAPSTINWTHGIYIPCATTNKAIQIGDLSSSAYTGHHFTSSNPVCVDVCTDDNNTALGSEVYQTIRARTMLFQNAAGCTIVSNRGQLKIKAAGVNFATGVFAGVQGYIELIGSSTVASGGKLWAVDACVELAASKTLTVDSGGIVGAFHAELTGAGTITETGVVAGLYIDSSSSTERWSYGIYIPTGDTIKLFDMTQVLTGSTALDASAINVTDSTTAASGYSRNLYLNSTVSGTKTGSGEFNALAMDITVSGNTPYCYGLSIWSASSGNPTLGLFAPITIYQDDLGNAVAAWHGISMGCNFTNAPTTEHDFINVRNHSGTVTPDAIIRGEGTPCATNFLELESMSGPAATGDLVPAHAPDGSSIGCDGYLTIKINTTSYYVPFYDTTA